MKKWSRTSIEKRIEIFKNLDYSFPEILAKRIWRKLPLSVRKNFLKYTA